VLTFEKTQNAATFLRGLFLPAELGSCFLFLLRDYFLPLAKPLAMLLAKGRGCFASQLRRLASETDHVLRFVSQII